MDIPKLDHTFRTMLQDLRFGTWVWAIHTATVVLWLINYYFEYSFLRGDGLAPTRPGLLNVIALSILNVGVLYYLWTRIKSSSIDYAARIKMVAVSSKLGDIYSTTRPLLLALEELFDKTLFAFASVCISSLVGALGYTVLLFGTLMEISNLTDILARYGGMASTIDAFWIKRLIFYGVNSILLWIFVTWSGLGSQRFYRMHEYRAQDYETEILLPRIREFAEELETEENVQALS